MKESVNNQVLFDKVRTCLIALCCCEDTAWAFDYMLIGRCNVQATYDKLQSEVPKYKMITTSILSDRLRVRYFYCCHLMLYDHAAAASKVPHCGIETSA